ncbi:MAG: hypothetical protein A2017_21415 [Lentisphaerae bacterium GWF2_44_16]|nr:MAG: hypothetical protein A2017_21415 [Lentisphaerae bacterium GWF2_44_16]
MQVTDFPKMVTVNSQLDGLGKEPRTAEQSTEEQTPILKAPLPDNAKPPKRKDERVNVRELERGFGPGWSDVPEVGPDALVVVFWGIDMMQDTLVAFPQHIEVHYRMEVGVAIHVVSG